jgi:hypothetical protein
MILDPGRVSSTDLQMTFLRYGILYPYDDYARITSTEKGSRMRFFDGTADRAELLTGLEHDQVQKSKSD